MNDCVFERPNIFPSIVGIFLRFRLFPLALVGDIEKAFLQIGLSEVDRDSLRCLWFDEKLIDSWPKTSECSCCFKCVPFGIKSPPFLLNSIIRYDLKSVEKDYPHRVSLLMNSLYVDDQKKLRSESIQIFSEMEMNMHKWNSNVSDIGDNNVVSVLGINWDTSADSLLVKFPTNYSVSTKRELTGLVCSLFDPLGFFNPFVVKLKILLQDAWQLKCNSDDKLPQNLCDYAISNDIERINSHSVPRHIGIFDVQNLNIEIHGYADASERAYATCIYLKTNSNNGSLLISKCRHAPKKCYF